MTKMPDARTVSLFRNGKNQAIRIPKGWEIPGEEARLIKDGDRLVLEAIEPVPERSTRSLVEWLKTLEPLDPSEEPWEDPEDLPLGPVTAFDDWKDE